MLAEKRTATICLYYSMASFIGCFFTFTFTRSITVIYQECCHLVVLIVQLYLQLQHLSHTEHSLLCPEP